MCNSIVTKMLPQNKVNVYHTNSVDLDRDLVHALRPAVKNYDAPGKHAATKGRKHSGLILILAIDLELCRPANLLNSFNTHAHCTIYCEKSIYVRQCMK